MGDPVAAWTGTPHSAPHYAAVKWGDTSMGIGFGRKVDLNGVWVAGHLDPASWTPSLVAIGYRDGVEVARSEAFGPLAPEPAWFAIGLEDVDRVVFAAEAKFGGAGFYAIDDLTYTVQDEQVIVGFDDLPWRTALTGTDYAGLIWETGTGDFSATPATVPHAPVKAVDLGPNQPVESGDDWSLQGNAQHTIGAGATLPNLVRVFDGPLQSDPGAAGVPDTMGAIGTQHFVVPLNFHLSIYDRVTEARLLNTTINAFFNTAGTVGDPRVVFDHHENRWIVLASDWSSSLWFAYSLTDDAMGAWFKTSINVAQQSDAGSWPDYPTLGVDENGIYSAALMVGGGFTMSIFAIDKAPLLGATPSISGAAFRQLPYEEAIQPCVTYGHGSGEYLVSRVDSTTARLRRVDPPLATPTLVEVGLVTTQSAPPAPNAPSMGAGVPIDTHSNRHMNAVYRNGSVWTAHSLGLNGRSAIGWYEIDAATATIAQQGTIDDPVQHYYVPAVAVNANGDALVAFSASSSSLFVGAWYSGRSASDPANTMADEAPFQPGSGPFNQFGGTQRWGDYSMASVDPLDDSTLWTIQQVAGSGNQWNMHIAEFAFPDCGILGPYCTAKTNSQGCVPTIAMSGTPSAASAAPFDVSATNVLNQKPGLMFYGVGGPVGLPFQGGTLCVAPPLRRTTIQLSGGSPPPDDCTGSYNFDVNAWIQAGQDPLLVAGTAVHAQFWSRDPAIPDGTGAGLTDGAAFSICP